jgi:hypothetical protein
MYLSDFPLSLFSEETVTTLEKEIMNFELYNIFRVSKPSEKGNDYPVIIQASFEFPESKRFAACTDD